MKTAIFVNNNATTDNRGETPIWRFIPDSALTNDKKPFFIPDFSQSFLAHVGFAIKIIKLGKGIPEKFAHRYYCQYAPAIHFTSPEKAKELQLRNLPDDMAVAYDKSLYIGKFLDFDISCEKIIVNVNNTPKCHVKLSECADYGIDCCIANLSRDNTLKTGDIIIPIMVALRDIELQRNTTITLNSNNGAFCKELLTIPIR